MQTLQHILKKATDELRSFASPTPEIDARTLLEDALEKDSVFLISNPTRPITNLEYARFRRSIRKRKSGLPIAYIIGHKEFYGYDFFVNKNVLIPRPETEYLVEKTLELVKPKSTIFDLGTGSGCIAVSLAKKLAEKDSNFTICASDNSKKALDVARKNANRLLSADDFKIKFFLSDLFSNKRLPKKFDLIIANLPYVPKSVQKLVAKSQKLNGINFEPQEAIFAEDNGTAIIKKFLDQSVSRLTNQGIILLELDLRNAKDLFDYAQKTFSTAQIKISKDLAQLNRYLTISR